MTANYRLNQTMLRIRDPRDSLAFYTNILGMTLIEKFDFPAMSFSLYFLGYAESFLSPMPEDRGARAEWLFAQPALLELTHNWGTESDPDFSGYHSGNSDPRGFGHIGISVPDVYAACARFEEAGVTFIKRPDDGAMKGLAFIQDPDGYWIEVLAAASMGAIVGS